MTAHFPMILAACAALVLGGFAPPGKAEAVCTAADVVAAAPGCPNNDSACLINSAIDVGDGCVLDFGSRAVSLSQKLTIGSGAVTINAGSFTILSGTGGNGLIDGIGSQATSPGNRGGKITINTTGDFETKGTLKAIDVSANDSAGQINIDAGGSVTLTGRILAMNRTILASGGAISIRADGDVIATSDSDVDASGGFEGDGGEVSISAGGMADLQTEIVVKGYYGGYVDVFAEGAVIVHDINATGIGDAGDGGDIEIEAGTSMQFRGEVRADGTKGIFETGGYGGYIYSSAGFGDLVVTNTAALSANGAIPDGDGGFIELIARGAVTILGPVHALAPPYETGGGDISIDAGLDVNLFNSGALDATGGDFGGEVDITAGRNVFIEGTTTAAATVRGGLGGDVMIEAGIYGYGLLRVTATIDVSSPRTCPPESGCGAAGLTELVACDLTLTSSGSVLAGAPEGGENYLTAFEQLTIAGTVDASMNTPGGSDGINTFTYPARKPPNLTGTVVPGPDESARATCTTPNQLIPSCLLPCPECGNGVIEFPETCDDLGSPQGCDGCSIYCQTETCDDGLVCTDDICDPLLGCLNEPVATECVEPTRTATGTAPTSTLTPTATPTPQATFTASATSTPVPTNTPSPSLTATSTATPTATPTPTQTETPTWTATPSATPTRTASATSSATATSTSTPSGAHTATVTPTNTPSATPTGTITPTPVETATATPSSTPPPPACPGDCSGEGQVAVNELITGVNIALGNMTVDVCQPFDTNNDRTVTISELIAAVSAALNGCN